MENPKHQGTGYSPQPKGKVLKTTLTYVIEYRAVELVPNWKLHPFQFMVLEGTCKVLEDNYQCLLVINPVTTTVTCLQDILVQQ